MNLLNLLMNSMLSGSSVDSLAKKTGISSKKLMKLLLLAMPILLKAMTSNTQSASGAQSLLGALTQHKKRTSFAEQIAEADADDGEKIVGHILGGDSASVMSQISGETGLSEKEVGIALANMAPALLSGLSAAASSASANQQKPGYYDTEGLLGMFGGMPASQQQVQSYSSQAIGGANGKQLLGALLSLMK